jgi:hypothetical protein
MSHPLTAYFLFGHFDTTAVANDATVADSFILSAMTFVVFHWPEYPLAKEAVTLRLIGSVVYSLRFKNFSV